MNINRASMMEGSGTLEQQLEATKVICRFYKYYSDDVFNFTVLFLVRNDSIAKSV